MNRVETPRQQTESRESVGINLSCRGGPIYEVSGRTVAVGAKCFREPRCRSAKPG
jgi:hypothetical protein